MRKRLLFIVFLFLTYNLFSCRKNAVSSFQNGINPVFISTKKITEMENSLKSIEEKKELSVPDTLIQFYLESKIDTIVPVQSNSVKQVTEIPKKSINQKEPRKIEQDINNSKISMWLAIISLLLPFLGLFFSALSINLYLFAILLGLLAFILGLISIGKVKNKLFSILGIIVSSVSVMISLGLILMTLLIDAILESF